MIVMIKSKINIYNKQRVLKITPEIRKIIRNACLITLDFENFHNPVLIDVSLVNDDHIKKINNEFRNIDKSTDVLSFPLGENGSYDIDPTTKLFQLGDIVISVEHAIKQSDIYGHSLEREIAFLTVHSVLHLLGYDHVDNESGRKTMEEKQKKVLEFMGLGIVKEQTV